MNKKDILWLTYTVRFKTELNDDNHELSLTLMARISELLEATLTDLIKEELTDLVPFIELDSISVSCISKSSNKRPKTRTKPS
ncbi:MAG: hypothetical protein KME64_03920 [Scytonematopsis contorta HA4267-MV1]|jgi:hypothetical protein|nr:hypothetical protein [Scytonematopsis contorta HA4267-MV1]